MHNIPLGELGLAFCRFHMWRTQRRPHCPWGSLLCCSTEFQPRHIWTSLQSRWTPENKSTDVFLFAMIYQIATVSQMQINKLVYHDLPLYPNVFDLCLVAWKTGICCTGTHNGALGKKVSVFVLQVSASISTCTTVFCNKSSLIDVSRGSAYLVGESIEKGPLLKPVSDSKLDVHQEGIDNLGEEGITHLASS